MLTWLKKKFSRTEQIQEEPTGIEKRQHTRIPFTFSVEIVSGDITLTAKTTDLSKEGVGLIVQVKDSGTAALLERGKNVTVAVAESSGAAKFFYPQKPGVIAWADGKRIGVRFTEPFSGEQEEELERLEE